MPNLVFLTDVKQIDGSIGINDGRLKKFRNAEKWQIKYPGNPLIKPACLALEKRK